MSETVVNQPLSEKVKEPHRSLAIDAGSTDTSANFTSDIKSDLAFSPGENHFTNSTDDCEEYTPEEMRQLELASQKLTNEVVEKPEYKKELDEMRKTIQKAFSSTLPLNMKMMMMQSAMEGLKTKINCIKDNNKSFKAKIIEIRKMSTGKPETEAGKNTEPKETPAEVEDSTMNESKKLEEKQEDSEPTENKKPEGEGEAKNEAKIAEIKKLIDQLKGQNEKWEETIALLKQQRNILLVTMEDRRDEIDDMQYLIKEKKTNLDKKVLYTEELRQKISKDSSNKPPTKSGGATHRKTISDAGGFTVRNHIPAAIGEKITDISTSVFNTSVFQDVSSKLTQVFGSVGRALGMTREDVNPDQILTADFLKEINQPPAPRGITSKDNARSTSQTPSKGQTKGHTRTMSTNLRPSKKV